MNKKESKYDFSLNTVNERRDFIEEKLSKLSEMNPNVMMGYSSKDRDDNNKWNKIPDMIDRYTTYYLRSKDAGSSRKTEYSFYVSEREEMLRKGNRELYLNAESYDGGQNRYEDDGLSISEVYSSENPHYTLFDEISSNSQDSDIINYIFSKENITKNEYKKILSMSFDLILESKDGELIENIKDIIEKCRKQSKDDIDEKILKLYIQGMSLREISDKIDIGKSTIDRRINNLMSWVGQN